MNARCIVGWQTRPVFLIVDGHPTHKAKLVREFVAQQGGRLTLWFLPPYSPELNPDELVWGHLKQTVAKKLPKTMDELKARVLAALRSIQKLPSLVASFFQHPTCRYAACSEKLPPWPQRAGSAAASGASAPRRTATLSTRLRIRRCAALTADAARSAVGHRPSTRRR